MIKVGSSIKSGNLYEFVWFIKDYICFEILK